MTEASPPFVSIIVPCRNERHHIAGCLDALLGGDYAPARFEVLVADGMSDDGTREVLTQYAARESRLQWFDNPARATPAGLNAALRRAHGDVIVLMGAHSRCAPTYVSRLVGWLERSGADLVGGVCLTRPGGNGALPRAIARALEHPFGVGNSWFRIGTSTARWVDTVPFGCYRRSVFERIGLFDEDLARNQDDEFNFRLLKRGGRILLVPDVTSEYVARDTLRKLARMYYQYGYFKPLVARKIGRVVTWRQLAPPALVLGLIAALAAAPLSRAAAITALALGAAYTAAALLAAAPSARRDGPVCAALLAVTFPVMHLSYGTGFLRGTADVLLRRRRWADAGAVPVTR